ncbi:MAG: MBL fold metallo-hydrolase [Ginsengibacter sp.]
MLIYLGKCFSFVPMSLFITSLNSGSNGNCYYIGNETEAVLVDAGISCKEIEKRLARLNLNMRTIKGIFISHEHSDHIKGLSNLSKKYQLPVYITKKTLDNGRIALEKQLVVYFEAHEKIQIGNLSITSFPKRHDACDPYSFSISCNEMNVGVFTDIGTPCIHLISHFQKCHAAFLESNYDTTMLVNGNYPYHLKKRISGGNGHLSNAQALEIFQNHRPPFMKYLFLAHLSKNNNCPDLVSRLFNDCACGVEIIVASRYEESKVYELKDTENSSRKIRKAVMQMELDFG